MLINLFKTLVSKRRNPILWLLVNSYNDTREQKVEKSIREVIQQHQQPIVEKNSRIKEHANFVNNITRRDQSIKAETEAREKRLVERDILATDAMTGLEFEMFIAQLYEDLGYKAEVTPGSGDQGVDVIITDKNKLRSAIQTKRYKGSVGNAAVQEVIAGRIFHKCSKSMVIANSTFTRSAISLAKQDGKVELIDRDALSLLIYQAKRKKL